MIIVYAISDNGDGYVQKIGEYESIEQVLIRPRMFADDVVIEIKEE